MSRKLLGILYTASVLLFCTALGLSEYKKESGRQYKVTVIPNHSAETSTSAVSLSVTDSIISYGESSPYFSSSPVITKSTKSSKTTKSTESATVILTTAVELVKESDEEFYEEIYIDINNADIDELIRLDGIGEVLASRIIDYRETNGRFNNIEEIMNVQGIGEGIFSSIADFIYVENPVYENSLEENKYEEYGETPENLLSEEITSEEPTEPPLTLEDIAPIELNSADIEQLILLPYVDEEIAQKIIELRESIHGFSHPYEIAYIDELSDIQTAEIVKYVYVEDFGI
ncbi:MAG: helix-hairpin-helix domain-containing protein [Ruminococcus sp.]|nr:helix-hairpin-helix domain-containing protein [Ruminococcus sp.]